jgi:hypothetical protein
MVTHSHRWASLFSPFSLFIPLRPVCKRQTSVCTTSKWKRVKDNRLGFRFHLRLKRQHININIDINIYINIKNAQTHTQTRKRNQRKTFVCCKRKTETPNFRLLATNGGRKWEFVFLGWQTINGNRGLLFQQTCPSMLIVMIICKNQIIKC